MSRSLGRDVTLGFAFESVFATPEVAGFKRLPFTSLDFGGSRGLLEDDRVDTGRTPEAMDEEGLDVSGSIGVPVDLRNFGYWLKLLFGGPTSTDESTHYSHVYVGAGATLPSMTLQQAHPSTPAFFTDAGVMGNELTMELTPRGWVNATIGLLGVSSAKAVSGQSLAAEEQMARFTQHNSFIELDDSQVANIVSGRVVYSNNLEGLEGVGDSGQIEAIDLGKASMSGQIRARFADATLIDKAIAGATGKLDFHVSRAPTERLLIVASQVKFARPRVAVSGPGGVEVDFDFMAEPPSSGNFCSATLHNDVTDY